MHPFLTFKNWCQKILSGRLRLCVPKISFCNIGDEGRRGLAVMCDSADTLNRPMERRIFVERAMNPRPIIIGRIIAQDPT